MEIEIWILLTHMAQTEMIELRSVRQNVRIDLKKRLRKTVENVRNLLSIGENYTRSYLFILRKTLLDQSLLSEVWVSIILYYEHQLNIYISYFLLE